MKHEWMRLIIAVLCLILLVGLMGVPMEAKAVEIVESGTCGENATWTLNDDGTVIISGTGEMVCDAYTSGGYWKGYFGTDMEFFDRSDKIRNVIIEEGITNIYSYAFCDCTNLTNIIIPDSVTEIGDHAFAGCDGLTSITIPDSVTYLGGFSGCIGLTSITIPDSVTKIGRHAFSNCTGLSSITIPDSITEIDWGAFSGCTGLTSITIPDNVTKIGSGVFSGCTGLSSITIPNSVTEIGSDAFSSCTGLSSITIPDSITEIDWGAFSGCTGLTSITIPDSVTEIGNVAFFGCTGLTSITIPDGVTELGDGAFQGCTSLKSITIPNSVTEIGARTFWQCTSLLSITISDSVTYIGGYAFADCTGIQKVTFLGSAPDEIGIDSFENVTAICYYPADNATWTENVQQNYGGTITWVPYTGTTPPGGDTGGAEPCKHINTEVKNTKEASCTEEGYTGDTLCTDCGTLISQGTAIEALGHCEEAVAGKDATCTSTGLTEGKHCSVCNTVLVKQETVPVKPHTFESGKCTVCGTPDPDYLEPTPTEPVEDTPRLAGSNRFETANLVGDQIKENLGIEKFDAVVVASGTEFADALAGSYLASAKKAPILLAYNDKINEGVKDYIKANLNPGGTVYILGGEKAVPESFKNGLEEQFTVKRLAGGNRFETNLLVLQEAGIGDKPILVCTGLDFADSLSASAAKLPILLVYGDKLLPEQAAFMESVKGRNLCIIGGDGAVSKDMETVLTAYGTVERVAGKNRFETSVMIAEKFFTAPESAVLAYAWDFPDGLCGGPLAATMSAPLILTMEKYESQAAAYIQSNAITQATILGGEKLIPKSSVNTIFN